MSLIEDQLFQTNRPQPLQFAPHGLSKTAPEGSLAAFQALSKEDWDGYVVHTYQIATGELVAFPEDSVDRLTNSDKGSIAQLPWDEVQKLTLNKGDQSGSIPLLSQVLELLKGSLVHIHCEGGFYGESTAASEIARLVTANELEESVFVTSPYLLCLRSYILDNKDLPHGWRFDRHLFGGPVSLDEHPIHEILESDIVVCLGADFLDAENVSALQERGLAVGTVRLHDEVDVKRACEAGVDWLVSEIRLSLEADDSSDA